MRRRRLARRRLGVKNQQEEGKKSRAEKDKPEAVEELCEAIGPVLDDWEPDDARRKMSMLKTSLSTSVRRPRILASRCSQAPAISYRFRGRQYIALATGGGLIAFALPQEAAPR